VPRLVAMASRVPSGEKRAQKASTSGVLMTSKSISHARALDFVTMETLKLLVVQAPCIGCIKVELEVYDLQAWCGSMLYIDASEHPYFKFLWGKKTAKVYSSYLQPRTVGTLQWSKRANGQRRLTLRWFCWASVIVLTQC
jgi:hypothetical protein